MKKVLFKINPGEEKGIALLFTLGILAVLLIIALGFATTSITERRAAGNNNDLAVARMLAESAVNRAMAAIKFYTDTSLVGSGSAGDIYSHNGRRTAVADSVDDPVLNRQSFDFLWKLRTEVKGSKIYDKGPADPLTYDPTLPNAGNPTAPYAVHWQYIDNGIATDDPTNGVYRKLVGRIAYVVVDNDGIDPAACVNHTVAASADEGAKEAGVGREVGDMEDRKGINPSEIAIYNLNPASSYLDATTLSKFSYNPLLGAGKLLTDEWVGWETMFSALGIVLPSTPTAADISTNILQRTKYREWFEINNRKDAEAFWLDSGGFDNKIQNTELYHRFNLARTDWDAISALGGNTAVAKLMESPTLYSLSSATNDGMGINWLKNYSTNLPAGTFPDAATRAKQIAANLIDYCRSKPSDFPLHVNTPTTDYTEALGIPTCSYMGNERTPYINELCVGIHITGTQVEQGMSGNYKLTLDVESSVGGELINMYGDNFAAAKLTIAYSINGLLSDSLGGSAPLGTECNQTYKLNDGKFVSITVGATPYKYDATEYPLYTFGPSSAHAGLSTVSFKNVIVTITSAKLEYPGAAIVDFANINKTLGPIDVLADNATTSFEARAYFGGIQANDPRQNINSTDWSNGEAITGNSGLAYGERPGTPNTLEPGAKGTPNATNYIVTTFPNVTMDKGKTGEAREGLQDFENGTDPAYNFVDSKPNVSTAYIRNAPMQSPWELGMIHRGAAWETINLKNYNTTAGVKDTGGIGNYADGDANILDQVKMSSQTQVYGKVNAQTASIDALKALLGYVRVGIVLNPSNDNPGLRSGAITHLTYTEAGALASAISGGRKFTSRAQITKNKALSNPVTYTYMDNDAKQEEVIGKIINLTKVAPVSTAYILVLAQSIKDVGTPFSGAGITINKDINQNGVATDTDIAIQTTAFNAGFLFNPYTKDDGTIEPSGVSATAGIPTVNETISGCKLGQYDLGADEILAEQKLLVKICYNTTTNKWEIISYEYLDD